MQTVLRVRYYSDAYIAADVADAKRKASCTAGAEAAARAWLTKYRPDIKLGAVSKLSPLNIESRAIDTSKDKPAQHVTYWEIEEPSAPSALPPLATVAVALGGARDRLDEMARRYDRDSLADRVWIGVCCLAARERHALSASEIAAAGGRAKAAVSRRDTAAEISPDHPHPAGFLGWLEAASPWLPRATAYKYMDAATGAGLTAWDDLDRVRAWASNALATHDHLTLAQLVREGRALPAPETTPAAPAPTRWEQMTFDSLLNFRAQAEQVISCTPHMSPEQHRIACARAYDTLKRLTGSPWQPSDHDVPDYLAVLGEVSEGGL